MNGCAAVAESNDEDGLVIDRRVRPNNRICRKDLILKRLIIAVSPSQFGNCKEVDAVNGIVDKASLAATHARSTH